MKAIQISYFHTTYSLYPLLATIPVDLETSVLPTQSNNTEPGQDSSKDQLYKQPPKQFSKQILLPVNEKVSFRMAPSDKNYVACIQC